MLNKKVVSQFISSLTAFTAFLYCFKVPVNAEEYIFIEPEYVAAYNAFKYMGFKQPDITTESNINLTHTITGSVTGADSFQLDLSNVRFGSYSTSDIYLGDYNVGNQSGSGYISGTNTGETICTPKSTSQESSKYTCVVSGNSYTFDVVQVKGFENTTVNGSFSGSINGSNIDFDISETGNIIGTVSSTLIYSSNYLINDETINNPFYIYCPSYSSHKNLPNLEFDLNPYIVAIVKGTFSGSSTSNSNPARLFKHTNNSLFPIFGSQFHNGTLNNNNGYISSICWWYIQRYSASTSDFRKNSDFIYPDDFEIIPIYVGSGRNMPDNIRVMIGIGTREEALQILGTNESITSSNNATNTNNTLEDTTNNLYSLENTFNDDLDNAFNNITIDNSLITNNGFINSAQWLSNQFTNIVSPTPINNMIMFSLILGLAMVLIGKVRN